MYVVLRPPAIEQSPNLCCQYKKKAATDSRQKIKNQLIRGCCCRYLFANKRSAKKFNYPACKG